MALSNKDRITKGQDHLRAGLQPFVEREMKDKFGPNWQDEVSRRTDLRRARDGKVHFDVQGLLKLMLGTWQEVFRATLGQGERAYVGELVDIRNRWAHDELLTSEDTERALDTMKRLLDAVSARADAEEVAKLKIDLQRVVFTEQARNKTRYQLTLEGMPKAGLRPWREVITPHKDVQSGRYAQAEFAANLADVDDDGLASEEYKDPVEFFRRTFITAGLRELLQGALTRLGGKGGDPVVELQTNFGGGKTHSMLALYHLFGGTPSAKLAGIEDLLKDAGVPSVVKARRAVLVGTALSPGQAQKKPDGTEIRTLWGELAWRLGGAEGYAMVAESDRHGTSPGTAHLSKLFTKYAPCLILVDEWVAYARQTVGKRDLPSGDFEAQASFAQALTEAAKAVDKVLVVASIPSSRLEIGGENGEKALETLKNVFHRVAKAWRPATADEGFEIVRRRLFELITDKDNFAYRDATVSAFLKLYKDNTGDFPQGSAEEGYKRDLENAYPIHPELLRRLYDDWSTLDKFQRTRGVLRLLAKVIHRLWEGNDAGLMIMPAFVPMDDGALKSELTQYLPDVWEPIISQDIDGEGSLPLELDRTAGGAINRVSACRRVARTLYIGTAPGSDNKNPGIDDRRVRLGCTQPGEGPAVFGDALRRLCDKAKYIHQDGNRYWVSTKANLNRLAEDRAAGLLREREDLFEEIRERLMPTQRKAGKFVAVHPCVETSSDVPDDATARLVILSPKHTHKKGAADSPARRLCEEILKSRGAGPRFQTNCLMFLAADHKDLDGLLEATSQFLAWKSLCDEYEALNLDPFQQNQAKKRKAEADSTVGVRLRNTWSHILVPGQARVEEKDVRWDEFKVSANDELAERVSEKLVSEGLYSPKLALENLRRALDDHLWGARDHVSVAELHEWFARYLYLPRVKNTESIDDAVRAGVMSTDMASAFALATGYDDARKRYVGLRKQGAPVVVEPTMLVVKASVAQAQTADRPSGSHPMLEPDGGRPTAGEPARPVQAGPPTHFSGKVALDEMRIGRDAGRIAEEVIQHLTTLPGAQVEVTLEVRAHVPGGIDTKTVRVVTENAKSLKFKDQGFRRE